MCIFLKLTFKSRSFKRLCWSYIAQQMISILTFGISSFVIDRLLSILGLFFMKRDIYIIFRWNVIELSFIGYFEFLKLHCNIWVLNYTDIKDIEKITNSNTFFLWHQNEWMSESHFYLLKTLLIYFYETMWTLFIFF